MARVLYSAALALWLPFVLLRLWWRGRHEPVYRQRIGERFGRYRTGPEPPVIWVHAVSVGEARAAAPLVRALQNERPGSAVLVTCTTAAGRETVEQVYGGTVTVVWLPYDFPGATRRFVERFRPRLGVIMETEIWPNLLAACRNAGIPVVLANARLSEPSARGYRRWRSLARAAFGTLAAVCAQTEADRSRLAAAGAADVRVSGNLKFDVAPDATQLGAGRAWRAALARPVLLLASTREGEERLLLDALPAQTGDTLIVFVPRHPQRFDAVASLLRQRGFAAGRRSSGVAPLAHERAYLGDSMGEMAFYYGAADVAVIGGSLLPLGGQNLIEACAAGTPVVLGPSMFNFAEATRLALEAGAALQASGAAEALTQALALCADPGQRARMGAAGVALCAAHRGAVERHLAVCREFLGG